MENSFHWAIQYRAQFLEGIKDETTVTVVSLYKWETAEDYISKVKWYPRDVIIAIFKIKKHDRTTEERSI